MSKIIAAGRLAVPTTTPGSTFNYTWANPNGSGSTTRYNRIASSNLMAGFYITQELINAGWNGVDPVVWTIEGYQSIYRQAVLANGYNSTAYYNRATIQIDLGTYSGVTPTFAGGLEIETGDNVYIHGQGGQGGMYETSTSATRGGGSAILTAVDFTLNAGAYNFILGGGGAGGPCNFADRDTTSSKRGTSTTYDNVFVCGGAGAGGHTQGLSTLNHDTVGTSMGALSTTNSLQSSYTSWANSDANHYGSANGYGGFQGGGGAIALWRRYPEFSATTQTLWGGGGGHYTGYTNPLSSYSTNSHGINGPNGSQVVAGRGTNYPVVGRQGSSTNSVTDDNIALAGGGGGGWGKNGGTAYGSSYSGLSSSSGTYYTYASGIGGYAIYKTNGATITYSGRTPSTGSTLLSTVVYMRGGY